jgi:hypothetical protein
MPIHSPPSSVTFKHYRCAAERTNNNPKKTFHCRALSDDACSENPAARSRTACLRRKQSKNLPSGPLSFQSSPALAPATFVLRCRGLQKTLLLKAYEISGLAANGLLSFTNLSDVYDDFRGSLRRGLPVQDERNGRGDGLPGRNIDQKSPVGRNRVLVLANGADIAATTHDPRLK